MSNQDVDSLFDGLRKATNKVPIQVYHCQTHGEFDVYLSFKDEIVRFRECPDCGQNSVWIIKPPAGVIVWRSWSEQANEQQRDPYTQAKAQAYNMYHEQKDAGVEVAKPSEEGIQLAAAKIAETR